MIYLFIYSYFYYIWKMIKKVERNVFLSHKQNHSTMRTKKEKINIGIDWVAFYHNVNLLFKSHKHDHY